MHWRQRVNELAAAGVHAKAIAARLADERSPDGQTPPKIRTIDRILAEWRKLPAEEQREYAVFSWPDTMASGVLPWSASAEALEYFRERDELELPRPLV